MHPGHLKKEFILKPRDDLLKQLVLFMVPKEKNEANDQIRINGLIATAALMYLFI